MALTKKAIRTKATLLESAKKLITERGFDRVSVEDITSGAGVAKGTFYHYFKSKEDLIRDLAFSQIQDLFAEAIKMDGPPEKKLAFYFGSLMRDAQTIGVNLVRQRLRAVCDPKQISDSTAHFLDGYKRLSSILMQGVEEGYLTEDTPVPLLTRLFMSHFNGALTTWCILGGNFDLSGEAKTYLPLDIMNTLGNTERIKNKNGTVKTVPVQKPPSHK